jgi:hypothetical protein
MPPGGMGYGGYGGTPPGVPPYGGGGNFPPPPGFQGQGEPADPPGPFSRLLLPIGIAGVISGLLGVIPLVGVANCCFCALNMAGIAAGFGIHFSRNRMDRVSAGEGAAFGALAGTLSGLIMALISYVTTRGNLDQAFARLPMSYQRDYGEIARTAQTMSFVIVPAISAAFGALWGFIAIIAFFKSKKRTN